MWGAGGIEATRAQEAVREAAAARRRRERAAATRADGGISESLLADAEGALSEDSWIAGLLGVANHARRYLGAS